MHTAKQNIEVEPKQIKCVCLVASYTFINGIPFMEKMYAKVENVERRICWKRYMLHSGALAAKLFVDVLQIF